VKYTEDYHVQVCEVYWRLSCASVWS